MPDTDIDALILKIHSTPVDPAGWPPVMAALKELFGAQMALMLRVSLRSGAPPWLVSVGFAPEALAAYGGHWAREDPWYLGAVARGRIRTGLVSVDDQLVERREFLSSAFFHDYLNRFEMDRLMNVVLKPAEPALGFGPTAVSFLRARGKPAFSDHEARTLERLAPHLILATRNTAAVQSFQQLHAVQTAALDAVAFPVFAVVGKGRLRVASVSVGRSVVPSFEGGAMTPTALKSATESFKQRLAQALAASGYTHAAGSVNRPVLLLLVCCLILPMAIFYGVIAIWFAETFPPQVRYTSFSLPYHLGVALFGGTMPAIGFALVTMTGDSYAGLWFPAIAALWSAAGAALFLKETRPQRA